MRRADIILRAELRKVFLFYCVLFGGGGSSVVRNICLRCTYAACVRACVYTRSCSKAAWSTSVHTSNT